MFNKLRKIAPIAFVGILLSANSAFAAEGSVEAGTLNFGNNTAKASLSEGSNVQSSNSLIGFGTIGTVDVMGQFSTINVNDYIRIDDNRGTNEGWQVKVSASDLVANDIVDKTTGAAGATIDVTIPIDSVFKVKGVTPTNLAGTLDGVTSLTTQTALSNDGITLMTASKGYGAGAYTNDLTYALSIPNYLPEGSSLSPSDATNSKFANVTDPTRIGTFAGNYSTTVQYSITVAP